MGDSTVTRVDRTIPIATQPDNAPEITGYAIDRLIGQGGMGVVWHAIELRLDRDVAIKVHSREAADVAHMWTEARLAAKVGDPGVVSVFDVGHTVDGRPYYTMEFVEGTDLHTVLRDGRLEVAEALRIGSEIARAVGAAHEKGIVHRDLKPRNVMIDRARRARVLDFGIAIRVAAANPRVIAGSPMYMSPEQVQGEEVGPPSDVYALGVMLYEMLGSRPPFDSADEATLFDQIRHEAPAALSSIVPVHPDVERVVMRCLAKDPLERFPSAAALFDAIEGLREGRPPIARVEARTSAPPATELKLGKPLRSDASHNFRWSWSFAASASTLWPWVSDTDSFNEAVGLRPVEVSQARESSETVARSGAARAFGLPLRWREYPFEWITNREHAVFRWYQEGPLEALWSRVALVPRSDGGTELTHEISLIPRGVLGRVAVAVEIGQRLRRAIDRVYRRIDEVVRGGGTDPYDTLYETSRDTIRRVDEGRRALIAAGFPVAGTEALADLLMHASSRRLARMRPFALAAQLGVSRDAALVMMLHASHVGLLELAWDVVCPTCQVAHETQQHLDGVKGHARCASCETEYSRDLLTSVELVFRVHPDVRPTKVEMFCAGSPARRAHILVQLVLGPQERRTITVPLSSGDYSACAFGIATSAELTVSAVGHAREAEIVVSGQAIAVYPAVVADGELTLHFVNDTADERAVRIEARAEREQSVPAVLALTNPTFRDYFREELLANDELIGVRNLFFLAVDASDRGALFSTRGDAEACAALRAFEDAFSRHVREESGAVIPGPLDTMVAAFSSGASALRAGVSLLHVGSVPVRAGIHGGRCLALTREARIDYFGETLHRTIWLGTAAEPNELILSNAAAGDRDLGLALRGAHATSRVDVASAGPYAGRRVVRVRQRA